MADWTTRENGGVWIQQNDNNNNARLSNKTDIQVKDKEDHINGDEEETGRP